MREKRLNLLILSRLLQIQAQRTELDGIVSGQQPLRSLDLLPKVVKSVSRLILVEEYAEKRI